MTGSMLELVEYQQVYFDSERLRYAEASRILSMYRGKINVEYPTPLTQDRWRLQSQGWVGTFPVSPDLHIRVAPKIDLRNLFGMWEYAYRLKGFEILNGMNESDPIEGFYSQLARVLASKVLDRERRGLAREYIGAQDRLPYIAGRLNMDDVVRRPWSTTPESFFHEHTADVEDNRLLAWTLSLIARSVLCNAQHTAPMVRGAYRTLRNATSPQAFGPRECINRLYTRLTQDYEPMHSLCRFFLEHSGPTHRAGDHTSLPFMVNMAGLFELFVAEWLKAHLPNNLSLKAQERVNVTSHGEIHYAIDLVIYDDRGKRAICVLDTKYKDHIQPTNEDLNQMLAYANLKDCHNAVLIYPSNGMHDRKVAFRGVDVHTLSFDLDGDLENAGQTFISKLFTILAV